jgi:hypothetical protein
MSLIPSIALLGGICASVMLPGQSPAAVTSFLGSSACKTCHPAIYERWSKTHMAIVRDPRTHPEVILPETSPARGYRLATWSNVSPWRVN